MTTQNVVLAKKLNIAAWIVSAVVLFLVGLMRQVKIPVPETMDFSVLPFLHAILNMLTAFMLMAALYFIKNGNIKMHQRAIYVAIGLSALFLLSYVTYHFTTPETIFGDINHDGSVSPEELAQVGEGQRIFYLVLLLSHIALAAISFPLILFTFIRAYTNQIERHKKMARWVYPIWLYVAITGPICYFMLMPYYN